MEEKHLNSEKGRRGGKMGEEAGECPICGEPHKCKRPRHIAEEHS